MLVAQLGSSRRRRLENPEEDVGCGALEQHFSRQNNTAQP